MWYQHCFSIVICEFKFVQCRSSLDRVQELCESGGGHPGLSSPNSPYGLCGRKATLNFWHYQYTSTWSKEIWGLRMESRLLELRVLSMWVVKERMLFSDNGRRSWKIAKRRGPRTDLCRTPKEMGAGSEVWQWMLTDWWIIVTAILIVVSLSVVLGDCCWWIFCSHEKCTIIVTECSALQGWPRYFFLRAEYACHSVGDCGLYQCVFDLRKYSLLAFSQTPYRQELCQTESQVWWSFLSVPFPATSTNQ